MKKNFPKSPIKKEKQESPNERNQCLFISPVEDSFTNSEEEKLPIQIDSPIMLKKVIKLKDLFPDKKFTEKLNLDDNIYKQPIFNFFKRKKKSLLVTEISKFILEYDKIDYPISEFKSLKGRKFQIEVKKRGKGCDDPRVILLSSKENNEKYIMKRYLGKYTRIEDKYISLDGIEFIEQKYNEFALTLQFANDDNTFTARPLSFEIFQFIDQDLICIEIFQEYAGEPITSKIPLKEPEFQFTILKRIIKLLRFLEEKKCPQNDIKCENIVFLNDFNDIKLIDFDIATLIPITVRNNKTINVPGYSLGYRAPEIVLLIQKQGMNSELNLFNPWKAQIYSLGIVMLRLMGYLSEKDLSENLDHFKVSSQQHEIFVKQVNTLKGSISDPLTLKIFEVINNCIQFNPLHRAFATELSTIMKKFKDKEISQIKSEFEGILKKREQILDIENLNKDKLLNSENIENMNSISSELTLYKEKYIKLKDEFKEKLAHNKSLEEENNTLKHINNLLIKESQDLTEKLKDYGKLVNLAKPLHISSNQKEYPLNLNLNLNLNSNKITETNVLKEGENGEILNLSPTNSVI